MKKVRFLLGMLFLCTLITLFNPLNVQAGHCHGSSDCGCSYTSCAGTGGPPCWYSTPWSYCVGHNFGSTWTFISSSATCTSGGYQLWRGYCSICQRWYELNLPEGPLGHNWGSWKQYSSSQHVRNCSRCGIADYGTHRMCNWYDGGDGWHYRYCYDCGYSEKYDFTAPSVNSFSAIPNNWSAGNGTVTINARDKGSGINYIQLYRTNVNSGATQHVATWYVHGSTSNVSYSYTETSEGVFYYTVYLYDNYGNQSSSTSSRIYLDHSNPVLYGMENTNTEWTNIAPSITVTATDYLEGTTYYGSRLATVVIYDDRGIAVESGTSGASYTLQPRYEGEHVWTIIGTDNVGHSTSATVITRYDISKPGIDGTEITFVTPDGVTVSGYCQDNIIDQHIDDEISRSSYGANKSSGLKSVILYRVTGTDREAIYSDSTKKTFDASDTHSYFDMYYEIQDTEKSVSYYEIIVTDFAGNRTIKKLTSQYSLLSWFHTSIDRSSYE